MKVAHFPQWLLGTGSHIRCIGKGRKERCTPLRKEVIAILRAWLRERQGEPADVLFPNARGKPLSRDGVEYLLAKHVATARIQCPSLKSKRVSPYVLRHSTAMDLLQHGVDRSMIALWLGHESIETTQTYLHANLQLKEQALAKTAPLNGRPGRYRPQDKLLAFCHPVARSGLRHSHGARIVGASKRRDDPDLYARDGAAGAGSQKPDRFWILDFGFWIEEGTTKHTNDTKRVVNRECTLMNAKE